MLRYRSYVGLTVFLWGVGLAPAASAANRAPTRGYAVCDAREMVALADGSLAPNACRASGFSDPDREPGFVFVKSTDCPEGAVSLSGGSLSAAPSAIASDCQVQLGVRDAAGLEPEGDSGLSVTVSVRSYSARLVASAPRVNAMQEGQTLQIPITLKAVSGRARTVVAIDGPQSLISVTKDGIDVMADASAKFSFGEDKKLAFTAGGDDSGRWEVVARSHSGAGHADAAIAFVVKDMNPPNYITVSRPRPGEELPVGAESYMVRGHCDAVGEPVTVDLGGAVATTTCRAGGVWSAKVALGAEGDKSMTAGYAEGAGATAAAAARSFRKGAAGGGEGGGGGGGAPAITFGSSSVDDGVEGNISIFWTAQNVPAPVYRYKVMLFNVDADAVDANLGNAVNGSASISAATVDPSASYVLIIENSMTEERIAQTSSFTLPLGTGGGGDVVVPEASIAFTGQELSESGIIKISWAAYNVPNTQLAANYLVLLKNVTQGSSEALDSADIGYAFVSAATINPNDTYQLIIEDSADEAQIAFSETFSLTLGTGGAGGGGGAPTETFTAFSIGYSASPEPSVNITWAMSAYTQGHIVRLEKLAGSDWVNFANLAPSSYQSSSKSSAGLVDGDVLRLRIVIDNGSTLTPTDIVTNNVVFTIPSSGGGGDTGGGGGDGPVVEASIQFTGEALNGSNITVSWTASNVPNTQPSSNYEVKLYNVTIGQTVVLGNAASLSGSIPSSDVNPGHIYQLLIYDVADLATIALSQEFNLTSGGGGGGGGGEVNSDPYGWDPSYSSLPSVGIITTYRFEPTLFQSSIPGRALDDDRQQVFVNGVAISPIAIASYGQTGRANFFDEGTSFPNGTEVVIVYFRGGVAVDRITRVWGTWQYQY